MIYIQIQILIILLQFIQAEKEEQAAKELAPASKDYVPAADPGIIQSETWTTETLDPNAAPTENWADDVPTGAAPTAAAVPPAAAQGAPAFPPSNEWGAVSVLLFLLLTMGYKLHSYYKTYFMKKSVFSLNTI